MEKIKVKLNNKVFEYESGIKVKDILKEHVKNCDFITISIVDQNLKELNYKIKKDCELEFLDVRNKDGKRVYMRTLSYIFLMAVEKLFPKYRVYIKHSLGEGLYCELEGEKEISQEMIEEIKEEILKIVEKDLPIERRRVTKSEAMKIFKKHNHFSKVKLFEFRKSSCASVYKCADFESYFYGYMLPKTSKIKFFNIQKCQSGLVLLGVDSKSLDKASEFIKQEKLFEIFKESSQWSKVMNVDTLGAFNHMVSTKKYPEMIRIVEAFHEKKISKISDLITKDITKKRVILISGPSSSGKTSFAQRLMIQLKVNQLNPVTISLDDYFVNREDTPKDEDGEYDFESINAIDLELFNKDLNNLLNGEKVHIPSFDFKIGKRVYENKFLQIDSNQPIIIEGIHGLNPALTNSVSEENKFKIYVSALTQMNLDEHNRIPTTDLRLIRRIVRDHQFRGNNALRTLQLWPLVRKGEEKNIFPFQENANIMFNSSLTYELAVLKKYVLPLLKEVDSQRKEYIEAKRLIKFLEYVEEIDDEVDIPPTSIIREFIGGSRLL